MQMKTSQVFTAILVGCLKEIPAMLPVQTAAAHLA
jgi:hypothetical protein